MRKLLILFFAFTTIKLHAQDPEFTQFYAAPLYLNPAFAGSQRCPRVALNYRNQWPALSGNFVTYSASYDQHIDAISGGLGILVLSDKAGEGTINTTNVSGMYAYQLNISRNFTVRMGLQATFVQKKLDWEKLTFGDMIDPRYGFVYQTTEVRPNDTRTYTDFSTGILGYSNRIYGGVAVNHITQPDEAFIVEGSSALPMKITAHLGAMLPVGQTGYSRRPSWSRPNSYEDGTYISPNVLYQQQQSFNQLNIGLYVLRSPLIGGLWYRGNLDQENILASDSFIALLGVQKGIFKFGYSYDVTVSRLANATAGSHEFTMGFQFGCKPKKKRFRTISCPSF